MDRVGADYFMAVASMIEKLGANAVMVHCPIGSEGEFKGMVDLVSMRAYLFLDETLGEELGHHLTGHTAGQIWRPFQGTVVALRSGCQQPPLGVGQFHGILHSVATAIGAATTEAPQWPGGRRGRIPEGLFAPGNR